MVTIMCERDTLAYECTNRAAMGALLCHGSELHGFMYSFRICMWQYPSYSVNCTSTTRSAITLGCPVAAACVMLGLLGARTDKIANLKTFGGLRSASAL